jgi:hypothetical protein
MLFRISAAFLPLAVGACAQSVQLPPADTIAPAAVPSSIAPPLPSVGLAYTSRAVTDPANWRELNDARASGAGGEE